MTALLAFKSSHMISIRVHVGFLVEIAPFPAEYSYIHFTNNQFLRKEVSFIMKKTGSNLTRSRTLQLSCKSPTFLATGTVKWIIFYFLKLISFQFSYISLWRTILIAVFITVMVVLLKYYYHCYYNLLYYYITSETSVSVLTKVYKRNIFHFRVTPYSNRISRCKEKTTGLHNFSFCSIWAV